MGKVKARDSQKLEVRGWERKVYLKGAAKGCMCPMRMWEDSILLLGFYLHSQEQVECTVLASGLIPFAPHHSGVPAKDHRELTPTRPVAWVSSSCLDQEAGDQGLAPFVTQ